MPLLAKLNNISFVQALMASFVLGAFYYFIVYDDGLNLLNQIQQANVELQTEEKSSSTIEQGYKRATQYQELVGTMGPTFQGLMDYLPAKMSMADLMRSISNEAKASGVNIDQVREAGSAKAQEDQNLFYNTIAVGVDLSGTFTQHLLFLSNLTRLPQILMIDVLSMSAGKSAEGSGSPIINMNATIAGYRYDEAAEKPKAKGGKK